MVSKQVKAAEIKVIRAKLDEWQSDEEIIKQLKISQATYYRYKQRIFKEDKKLLEKVRTNELAHRIMQVRKSLEYCIKVNKGICEHSKDDKAKIEASAMIVKANMGLLNLATNPHYDERIRIISRDISEQTKKLSDK